MIRLETVIPAIIATIMLSGIAIGSHRAGVKDEFIAGCRKSHDAAECQNQWWRANVRQKWSTNDLWACWVGNPDACAEEAERMKSEQPATPTAVAPN